MSGRNLGDGVRDSRPDPIVAHEIDNRIVCWGDCADGECDTPEQGGVPVEATLYRNTPACKHDSRFL